MEVDRLAPQHGEFVSTVTIDVCFHDLIYEKEIVSTTWLVSRNESLYVNIDGLMHDGSKCSIMILSTAYLCML